MSVPVDMRPPPHLSWQQVISQLPQEQQQEILDSLKDQEAMSMSNDWFLTARREQLPPEGEWQWWIIMAGRGFGKNFSGSNWLCEAHYTGAAEESCIVAATAADLRRYCVDGPSGVLSQAPDWFRPTYVHSQSRLIWPDGAFTNLYSSEKPDRLRGGNYSHAWCDELSYWAYPEETWSNLQLTLRRGENPRTMVTMTPRPTPLVRRLLTYEGKGAVITRGSTLDNKDNLADQFIDTIIEQYRGTRLYRQEVEGELLADVEGALWSHEMLDESRWTRTPKPSAIQRTVVAIDPSTTSGENADETGIVGASRVDGEEVIVRADKSKVDTPRGWALSAISLYHELDADLIVAEKNQGGEMISEIIHNIDKFIKVKLVHASKGKVARAEPVASLYEQGRVHHIGVFPKLEDEMCIFVPGDIQGSPNRVDALVWAVSELLVKKRLRGGVFGR